MSKILIKTLILLLVYGQQYFCGKYGTFGLLGPSKLIEEKFSDMNNDFNVANFGEVPFGQTILGQLYLAQPNDACNIIENKVIEEEEYIFKIFLAERGNCSFVTKAHYAQMSGAVMLVIIDSDSNENVNNVLMVDDDSGVASDLKISTLLISYENGQKLKQYLQSSESEKILIFVNFQWPTAGVSKIEVWIRLHEENSYKILKELLENLNGINQTYWKLEIHYQLYECLECAIEDYKANFNTNCLSGGRYCAIDPNTGGSQTGKDVLIEILIRNCIKMSHPENWLEYLVLFGENCVKEPNYLECSKNIVQNISKINYNDLLACVDATFEGSNKELDDNKILKSENQLLEQRSIVIWPSIYINEFPYRGNLRGEYILDAVCDVFINQYDICSHKYGREPELFEEPQSYQTLFIWIISILSIFFCVFYLCYRRKIKRELAKEMTLQINTAISHYLKMQDTSTEQNKPPKKFVEAQYI